MDDDDRDVCAYDGRDLADARLLLERCQSGPSMYGIVKADAHRLIDLADFWRSVATMEPIEAVRTAAYRTGDFSLLDMAMTMPDTESWRRHLYSCRDIGDESTRWIYERAPLRKHAQSTQQR